MQEDFEKGTPEAHDEGAINPETGVGPREVLKSFGFRGSAELYIALRELVPAGSLSTAMYIGVGRIPDFPVTRSHPPASWPSAANSSICRTYRKTAGEESRRRSPVANRWMRP